MECKNCGSKFDGNFCPVCGTAAEQTGMPPQQVGYQAVGNQMYQNMPYNNAVQPVQQKKGKKDKPIYKKWWFWLLVLIAFCILVSALDSDDSDNTESSKQVPNSVSESAETTTEAITTTTTTTTTTTQKTLSEKEFKSQCKTISFDTLSRNPDKYKGNKYKFTGEVIQVVEQNFLGKTYCDLRINVTKNDYYWEDTIYATVVMDTDDDRILEDDIITIWGTCDGLYTYESVLGSSISLPSIDVEYFKIG